MKKILSIILTILFAYIYYYLFLPALNIHNITLYLFIIFIILFYYGISLIFNLKKVIRFDKRIIKLNYLLLAVPAILVLIMLWNFIESPLFMASKYANRIEVDTTKEFNTDIQEVDFSKLPLLDKTSSKALGDRVMGQMSDLVSQYDVSNIYTQINYNNKIIRVTPLEYASPIKWLTNRKEGVKGYITVDSTTGKSELIRLDKGMKYVESGLFNDNVYRKLRFKYPTKNFGNISFEIEEGDIFGFIGPNGAGKSTLIKTILGLYKKDSGEIYINGCEIEDFTNAIEKVSAIIETPDFYQYLSGYDNLKMRARIYNVGKDKIDEVVDLVGLTNRIKDKVSKYSLGMKQRLGIAMSLLNSPNLLILDEPTNGLDPEGIKDLRSLLKDLSNSGVTIFISSHILRELDNFCNKICMIKNGSIVETTSINALKHKDNNCIYMIEIDNTENINLLFKNEVLDKNRIRVWCNREFIPVIVESLVNNKNKVYAVYEEEISLEDAFLDKIGGNEID